MDEKMIFLSNSIEDISEDIIGFDTYVDKLNDAIDANAQMIAITSPFGSGKTSIIELLKKKRASHVHEEFLQIQMWSELNNLKTIDKSCELHKNFLYQLGSSLDTRKGTYINRRLSNNYGLLKLHVSKSSYWVFLIVAICCAVFGWFAKEYENIVQGLLRVSDTVMNYVSPVSFLIAIVFLLIIVARAEIIFSSKDSENQRTIEPDEIIDLYRNEILNRRGKLVSWFYGLLKKRTISRWMPCLKTKNYIVIIEDLDRTDDGKAVVHFLKELRKYYIPTNCDNGIHQNKVVFIVNIKSESAVFEDAFNELENSKSNNNSEPDEDGEKIITTKTENQSEQHLLYAKLFDYVLNLQTINIVDYDAILCGLLEKKKNYLNYNNLNSISGKLSEIPGMQWLIRGENLDIRKIKNRLNKAFVIFETLKERFPIIQETIDFQKCAVAAYLTTEYEFEFSKTDDKAFAELIEQDLQGSLTIESTQKCFKGINDKYVETVYGLIKANLIEDDYRMYFYNYPKNSIIRNNDENIVQKAILYNVDHKNLDAYSKAVIKDNSKIIKESLKKLKQLNLPLPTTVINTETLFLETLRSEYQMVLEVFSKMDSSDQALDKNLSDIVSILKYDRNRKIYNKRIIGDFCTQLEKCFNETNIIKLRETLCIDFKHEIMWYASLFFGEHNVISTKEMDSLYLQDVINLLNIRSINFSVNHIKYIVERFIKAQEYNNNLSERIKNLLKKSIAIFEENDIVDYCLKYMFHIGNIDSEFEEIVYELLKESPTDDGEAHTGITIERQNEIFQAYKNVINSISINNISDTTLSNISNLYKFEGSYDYTLEIANKLYENQHYLMSTLVKLHLGHTIDYSDYNLKQSMLDNIEWLKNNPEEFLKLRYNIVLTSNSILDYVFCFGEDLPAISNDEFELLIKNPKVKKSNLLDFFPSNRITEESVDFITKFFNQGHVNNNIAFNFLISLSKYKKEIVKSFFKKIDFIHACCYYAFSHSKKKEIKALFDDILDLQTIEGKLNFMENTRFLDCEFEEILYNNLDSDMQKKYISIVRKKVKPNPVSSITVKNLVSFSTMYSFDESTGVNETLLKEKEYEYYIVSTTLSKKKFTMESDEKLELLWPIYVEMYSDTKRFSKTREYMKESRKFLIKIREKESYKNFSEEILETLTLIKQDENLINYIFSHSDIFATKYFYSLKSGFVNRDAAKAFLKQLETNVSVLKSDSVRYVVYDMLVDPGLKSQYTKLRKNCGCKF